MEFIKPEVEAQEQLGEVKEKRKISHMIKKSLLELFYLAEI